MNAEHILFEQYVGFAVSSSRSIPEYRSVNSLVRNLLSAATGTRFLQHVKGFLKDMACWKDSTREVSLAVILRKISYLRCMHSGQYA